MPGNESEYSDIVKTLNEKISLFKARSALTYSNGYFPYPSDMHKLGTLYYRLGGSSIEKAIEVQEINPDELMDYNNSPLTSPTRSRPIYIRSISGIEIFSKPSIVNNIETSYIKRPTKVEWGYVVTNEQALYNANTSNDFQLHDSEETVLVEKILGLAGIIMQKPDLAGIGQQQAAELAAQQEVAKPAPAPAPEVRPVVKPVVKPAPKAAVKPRKEDLRNINLFNAKQGLQNHIIVV